MVIVGKGRTMVRKTCVMGLLRERTKQRGVSEYGKCATYIGMRAVSCGRHGEPRSAAPVVDGAF